LVREQLRLEPGETVLDAGCGTGFFTRALAASHPRVVVGMDANREWVRHACERRGDSAPGRTAERYQVGDLRALPYTNGSFDAVVSVAALCFVDDERAVVRELVRVTRRRFAIGLLNRISWLWLQKGRGGGHGSYRGAHWHTPREARDLLRDLPVVNVRVRTAVQLPSGGSVARLVERACPAASPLGAFLLISGDATGDLRR
jgi:SAM-dependent methyltransferase